MTKNDLIEALNKMTNEQQAVFYNCLRAGGLSESEILAIQGVAFYTKLYSDPELYREVRAEMGHQMYKLFTQTPTN